jgi:hypothetical protein
LLDFDKSDQFDDITSLKKIKKTGDDGKSESERQSEDISKLERKNLKIESIFKDLSSGEKQRLKN